MSTTISWTNDDGSLDVVQLDIYETETHDAPCEVSEFPVEDGLAVTDNIRLKPKTLVLEGYVTDIPLPENVTHAGDYNSQSLQLPARPTYQQKNVKLDVPPSPLKLNVASLATAGFNALAGAIGLGSNTNEATVLQRVADTAQTGSAKVWQPTNQDSRVIDAFRLLTKGRDNKVLCQVVTDFATYDNMAFVDLNVPRKTEDGNGAPFSVSFQQIRLVSAQTVNAPKPAETGAQRPKTSGSKATKDSSEDAAAKRKTILASLLNQAGL